MQRISTRGVGLLVLALAALPGAARGQSAAEWGVSFPTSATGEAQRHFDEGVTAMHLFMFEDAEEHFRAAQAVDSDFAMAYWGEALTAYQPVWRVHNREKARAVLADLGPTAAARAAKAPTRREKDYLETLEILYGPGEQREREQAYADAMKTLSEQYPDDTEALAFYAVARLMQYPRTPEATQGRMDTAAVAQQVLDRNPRHPGALRYLIQSTDDPVHTSLGLSAARMMEKVEPTVSTAIHLPTHVRLHLGEWEKAADGNMRAFDASMRWTETHGYGYEALNGHNYAHLLRYGHHAFLQLGQQTRARAIRERIAHDYTQRAHPVIGLPLAQTRARHLIESEAWDDAAALHDWITAEGIDDLQVYGAIGLGAARSGDIQLARKAARAIAQRTGRPAQITHHEVEAVIHLAERDEAGALELIAAAAAMEDDNVMIHIAARPMKPPHELYGDILLAVGRPADALEQFERALQIYRNRPLSLMGAARASVQVGDMEKASGYYTRLAGIWSNADADHPGLAEARRMSN
jgi:hypothetical protein